MNEEQRLKANERAKRHYEANKQAKIEYQRKWREENREAHREYSRKWNTENKEAARERIVSWYKANPGKRTFHSSKRKQAVLKATPTWLSEEQLNDICTTYELSAWCSSVMNTLYHVDHIIPLQGKTVCGLHVPWNLRVIPASVNMSKGNKYNG